MVCCGLDRDTPRGEIRLFYELDHAAGRLEKGPQNTAMDSLNARSREEGYVELVANIRRLTVMVVDNLEAGSRDRTLDQGQKRLLSSTGARLLRLWRVVLREGGSQKVVEDFGKIEVLVSAPVEVK